MSHAHKQLHIQTQKQLYMKTFTLKLQKLLKQDLILPIMD